MSIAIVPASAVAAPDALPFVAKPCEATEARRRRGLAIAAQSRIVQKNGQWVVPSQTGNGVHRVNLDPAPFVPMCTCKDYVTREQPCKHVWAVRFVVERESRPEVPDATEGIPEAPTAAVAAVPSEPLRTVAERPTYRQNWPAYNAAQINEKSKFQTLLVDLCAGIPEPARQNGKGTKGGRPPVPMADRVFAMAFKVYSTQSGRRASSDMRDAREKGHLSHAPTYSAVSRYLEDPAMTPILTGLIAESAKPLRSVECDFAVDSSGFATSRFVRWFDHKYGIVKQEYDWVKCSIVTGVKTNIVTAVEIDERYAGDCPKFAPLITTTAETFRIREVSADTAYSSYENNDLVAFLGGKPFIAFKANANPVRPGVYDRMYHYYSLRRDEFLAHYHKRSNVETRFSMIKAKFGDSLRSKTDVAMVNEALCKVLGHNLCVLIQSAYELGVAATFWGRDKPVETQDGIEMSADGMPIEGFAWV